MRDLSPSLRIVLLLCAASTSCGCQHAALRAGRVPPELMAPPAFSGQQLDLARLAGAAGGNDRLQPGDLVEVSVVTGVSEIDRFSVWRLQISADGVVDVPLVGPVLIAGLQYPAAGMAIRDAGIQRGVYLNPRVTVQMKERYTRAVTVTGAVAKPGVYKLPPSNSDLVAALVAAGGLSKDAATIVEIRQPPPAAGQFAVGGMAGEIMPASYQNPAQAGQPINRRIDLVAAAAQGSVGLPLQDGAVVVVEKQPTRTIYVSGLVKRGGQFEMPPDADVRLLGALAMAGGRTHQIADKVTVVRQNPSGGPPVTIAASVREAERNGETNLRLAPGDVVHVAETPATFTLDALQRFIRFGFSARVPGL